MTISIGTIYSSTNPRNFLNRLPRKPFYSVCTTAASSVLDFRPYPRKESKTSNICRFSFYHTRIAKKLENCNTSGSINNIRGNRFCGLAIDPLKGGDKMTVVAPPFSIEEGSLLANGTVVLKGVPSNVAVYPVTDGVSSSSAAFLGATSSVPGSRHVFGLGVLQEFRFMCIFRHKIWWMIPRFGSLGNEIPIETQMLLLEVKEESSVGVDSFSGRSENTFYVLFLPVLEGQFRATLQGNSVNELEFCVESGDAHVQTSKVTEAVFIKTGDNPFELIRDSIKILETCKGTFTNVRHKKKPAHLDWFGWCTWDAFYKDVSPQGIKEGLESFLEGGCPPKFLIIDDGWQDTFNEFQRDGEPFVEGSQFATRLVDIKECSKFVGSGEDTSCHDLQNFVKHIKDTFSLKYVYVWHALIGYWGGLLPYSEKMKKYNPKLKYPVQSPGNVGNLRDIAMDSMEKYGIGLIDPEKVFDFYNDLHGYLSSNGIDGVKVDVQNLIETLGTGYGGRVALMSTYQKALEESIVKNFQDNNLICCMSLNTDYIYSSKRSATARASEDFMPRQPSFQTLHVASVAFNSLLLGEIVVPDWDMFQSHHYTAEFHGAARAVGGCPVYVSDKPGMHDFNILKKLVLPDGSVLRAKYAGRPTRDCLFVDTVMDGKSLLKIWNLNKLSGVVGVFNCQGAGNWPLRDVDKHNHNSSSEHLVLSGYVSPLDVDFLGEVADEKWNGHSPLDVDFLGEVSDEKWNGDCAVYAFRSGSLSRLPKEESIRVSLDTLECEVYTITPIQAINDVLDFAPIGLIDMYNAGGATEGLGFNHEPSGCSVRIEARGCGRFGAYSSKKPIYCTVDGNKEEFKYNPDNGLLIVELKDECQGRVIDIHY